jgi:hypothetical protein
MSSSVSNTTYGYDSQSQITTGLNNTSMGAYALQSNTTAIQNTAMGTCSLLYTTTGSNNTAIGSGSMCMNTTGTDNTAVGSSALEGSVSTAGSVGSYNTALGAQALFVESGNYNVGVGYQAGIGDLAGTGNTYVGACTDVSGSNIVKSTALGYGAIITESNQIMVGSTASTVVVPGILEVSTLDVNGFDVNGTLTMTNGVLDMQTGTASASISLGSNGDVYIQNNQISGSGGSIVSNLSYNTGEGTSVFSAVVHTTVPNGAQDGLSGEIMIQDTGTAYAQMYLYDNNLSLVVNNTNSSVTNNGLQVVVDGSNPLGVTSGGINVNGEIGISANGTWCGYMSCNAATSTTPASIAINPTGNGGSFNVNTTDTSGNNTSCVFGTNASLTAVGNIVTEADVTAANVIASNQLVVGPDTSGSATAFLQMTENQCNLFNSGPYSANPPSGTYNPSFTFNLNENAEGNFMAVGITTSSTSVLTETAGSVTGTTGVLVVSDNGANMNTATGGSGPSSTGSVFMYDGNVTVQNDASGSINFSSMSTGGASQPIVSIGGINAQNGPNGLSCSAITSLSQLMVGPLQSNSPVFSQIQGGQFAFTSSGGSGSSQINFQTPFTSELLPIVIANPYLQSSGSPLICIITDITSLYFQVNVVNAFNGFVQTPCLVNYIAFTLNFV